jgi:hypothetical protein
MTVTGRRSNEVIAATPPSKTNPFDQSMTGLPIPGVKPDAKEKTWPGVFVLYTYADGTQEVRFFYEGTQPGESNGVLVSTAVSQDVRNDWIEQTQGKPKSPLEQQREQQIIQEGESKTLTQQQEDNERSWNQQQGHGWLTHAEYAAQEQRRQQQAIQQQQEERAQRAEVLARENQARQQQLDQQRLGLDERRFGLEETKANQPTFLSQAGTENPYLVRFNPQSGQAEQVANPNFDAVKQEAERVRSMLAVQIQARQVTLDEAKQQYSQWFDQNVKTPLMLSQEARDKAAEQRSALDAEERRRQFAATFGLQKAQLGEQAGESAVRAEESLLPYRAGPTESAEMSSAINSLSHGGSMANDASAGINFTPGAFQFDAPDFKKIAAQAAAAAVGHLSSYKPSSQSYQTADYSNVPAVNTSGAPTIPSGYGDFQSIIDNLKSTYNFGGSGG